MIKVEHLAKSFGTLQVLKDISLSINKGEVVTIIGPSGSGKSTLLRCLNLLERPDSGKIIFDGTDILSGKVKIESIRKNACMVFQHFNLFANMTALQNVAYAPRVVNGLSRADAEAKAQKLLEKVGLGDKSGQRIRAGQAITIPFPSLQLLKCRMGKRINRSFKDCHMPAARTLRGITKVISFVAAIDILFEIAADTAHTGKLRFPGIIFPNKHTNRFSMIPGFVKNPGL